MRPARGFGRTHGDTGRQAVFETTSRIGALVAIVGTCLVVSANAQQTPRETPPIGKLAPLPGVRLWFSDSGGRGEPIVLMHAITGTSESWEAQITAFSKAGYRVVTFDRRGWGRSQADPATGPQPGHAADDLQELADFLSLGRFHLVGVAGGGFVALDYAAAHPERLSSLVVG